MIVLGLDLETTGLDTGSDRPIELAYVLWDTEDKKAVVMENYLLYDDSYPTLTEEITKLTGIKLVELEKYSVQPQVALNHLLDFVSRHNPSYIVSHNGEMFDKPLLLAELHRQGFQDTSLQTLPWVDTRTDLPFVEVPDSMKLKHLACDMGFINPFPHRALSDVLTMLKVMSQFEFSEIEKLRSIPWITVRAVVDFDNKEKAKARRYSWEKIGEEVFPKQWVKRIKENKYEEEKAALSPFQVVRLK